jgi:hypothetical protein
MSKLPEPTKCPDCGVEPGTLHLHNLCDVARCADTGFQRLGCGHKGTACNTVWTGHWPGEAECHEYGFLLDHGPGQQAFPDLNRLYVECEWDPEEQRMVRRPAARHLFAAARDADLAAAVFDDRPHGISFLNIPVPSGGQIWISNADSTVHHPATEHAGWIALYYPHPEDSDECEEIYDSTSTDCAPDSVSCIQAVTAWLAGH